MSCTCTGDFDFLKHLTLSALHSLFAAHPTISTSGIPLEYDLNELDFSPIVSCIQFTPSKSQTELLQQIRNAALRLLSVVSSVLPNKVSELVLPVFSSALDQGENLSADSSYSFIVLRQSIEAIVPSLVSHVVSEISSVARTLIDLFVQSIFKISRANQCQLLSILVESLGPSLHLPCTLLTLLQEGLKMERKQSKAAKNKPERQQLSQSKHQSVIDLASNLCLQFSPFIQVTAFARLIEDIRTGSSQKLQSSASALIRLHLSNVTFLRQVHKQHNEQVIYYK